MSSEEIRQFDDPLMGRLDKQVRDAKAAAGDDKLRGRARLQPTVIVGIVALLAVLAIAGYFLYDARRNLDTLSESLASSQQQLGSVTQELESSKTQLASLEQNLGRNEQQLTNQGQELSRYKTLYRDLKQQQADQHQELETISIRKADQAAVDALADQTHGLEGQVGEINSRVGQINSNISDLREQTTQNRSGIEETRTSVDQLRLQTQANQAEIAAVKNSLERDYYSFELQKNGSVIKVFDVALSLKDTDFGKQRYHVEILAGGKRIRKKRQAINEPIYFYVEGKEKPYELVVERVDKKFVTGHLSVPKS